MSHSETRTRSILGAFAKVLLIWVAIPCALGCLGYYVIGPKISAVPALDKGAKKIKGLIDSEKKKAPETAKTETEQDVPVEADNSGLNVEVSVEPAVGRKRTPITPIRRPRTTTRPRQPRKPAIDQPADEPADGASVGGIDDAPKPPRRTRKPTGDAAPGRGIDG